MKKFIINEGYSAPWKYLYVGDFIIFDSNINDRIASIGEVLDIYTYRDGGDIWCRIKDTKSGHIQRRNLTYDVLRGSIKKVYPEVTWK